MSEEVMVESIETALRELGVPEEVEAAGEFQPRGHTGSMFAGRVHRRRASARGFPDWATRSPPSAA